MPDRQDTARAIATQSLEATGKALARGDHAAFARCVRLPYSIGTETGATVVDTPEALRAVFDRSVESFDQLGVTRLERRVTEAVMLGPDRIVAAHLSLPYSQDEPWEAPYPNHVVLQRAGDGWRINAGQHVVGRLAGHSRVLVGETSGNASDAQIAMFSDLLHRFNAAELAGDFDAYMRCVQLPFLLHREQSSTVIATEAELRKVFEKRTTLFLVHNVTDIVRLVKKLTVLGPNRMHGVVRTHLLHRTTLVMPAYTNAATLFLGQDGTWRISSSTAAESNGLSVGHLQDAVTSLGAGT